MFSCQLNVVKVASLLRLRTESGLDVTSESCVSKLPQSHEVIANYHCYIMMPLNMDVRDLIATELGTRLPQTVSMGNQ